MIKLLDIFSAGLVLVSLYLIPKHYRWWLLYALSAFCYFFVRLAVGHYGSVGLEIFAFCFGVRNYIILRKKNNAN